MAIKNHYEATFKDGTVVKRISERAYTHAVTQGGGHISWAGSLRLAQRQIGQPWQEIAEARLVKQTGKAD